MDFQYGGDSLRFSPERRLEPKSARRHLTGLGISPPLVEMAVDAIERQAKEGFPKADHVRYDLWFRGLTPGSFAGEKIKEVVATTPERTAKWDHRLRKCGRTWDDITLSEEAIVRITEKSFNLILKQPISRSALEKRFIRWKKREWRVHAHGLGGNVVPPSTVSDS